ncbi:hypothetical protein ACES2I_13845 [Bdellovibrio bacteriovorus]|uniref:hypothetical protein n=1 Tax=Bdellovibrio bacteriovorus TaxID=959 RepID=UPI0035A5D988
MKNFMIPLLLLLFSLTAGASTGAIMGWSVNPVTGEELYACNAKIRSLASSAEQICLNLSDGESCDPTRVGPTDGPCQCYSKEMIGNQIVATRSDGAAQAIHSTSQWKQFMDDGNLFNGKLNSLEVQLGSEILGAEYGFTYCYKGPFATSGNDQSLGSYGLDFTLQGSAYAVALDSVEIKYACDLRYRGQSGSPRQPNSSPNYGDLYSDFVRTETIYKRVDERSPKDIGYQKIKMILNQAAHEVPRFCVVEVRFKERSGKDLKRDALATTSFNGSLAIKKQGSM